MPRLAQLAALVAVLLVGTRASATGPSSAYVRLFPLAARDGHVLFATRWTSNPTGAHAAMRIDYGWLVASANGTWDEVPHRSLVPKEGYDEAHQQALDRERDELDASLGTLNWDTPPASLVPLLRKYGFSRKDVVDPSEGSGSVIWTPELLCRGKRCASPCVQRSLRGLRGENSGGWPVGAVFVHSGIALFHNASGHQEQPELESETSRGPSFYAPRPLPDWPEVGIDIENVSGLCVLPRALRSPAQAHRR